MRKPREVIYPGFRWFVLRVEGSYEKRAALTLETYGRSGHVPDFDLVKRIWVPQMTVQTVSSGGAAKTRRVSALPGYLLVETILTYELFSALQRPLLPHVFGWLRFGGCWPSPLPYSDIYLLYQLESQDIESATVLPFDAGDVVKLPSLGITGEILALSQSRIIVEATVFKRKVAIEVHRGLFSEIIRVDRKRGDVVQC